LIFKIYYFTLATISLYSIQTGGCFLKASNGEKSFFTGEKPILLTHARISLTINGKEIENEDSETEYEEVREQKEEWK
jgi:hypothetical protein